MKSPKISSLITRSHHGWVAISNAHGTVLGIGKNSVLALEEAKKKYKDIENSVFVVSRIRNNSIPLAA